MKAIDSFTVEPMQGFAAYADGQCWHASKDEDYGTQRSFLGSMTRWANQNGYVIERVVGDDYVEFRLTESPNLVAIAEIAKDEKKGEESF